MKRSFATVRLVLNGRLWIAGIPLLAALVVGFLVALTLIPASAARGDAEFKNSDEQQAQRDREVNQQQTDHPDFMIAVGIDDEPREMAALQSGKTDWLSFAEEFENRLQTGAVASDFGSHERVMSPASAREQVADGTSALAIVFPKDFTLKMLKAINSRAMSGAQPKKYQMKVDMVAGPQARAQKNFVLDEYREQVVTQALEFSRDQIRITARKWQCADTGTGAQKPCKADHRVMTKAFDQAYAFKTVRVDGPKATEYRYESLVNGTSNKVGAGVPAATEKPDSGADTKVSPELQASRHSYSVHWANIGALPVVLVVAVLVLGTATSVVVGRNVGVGMRGFGPWRRWGRQRPISRAKVLGTKMRLTAVGSAILAIVGTVWCTAVQAADGFGSFLPHDSFAVIATGARLAVFFMAGLLLAWLVVSLFDVLGGLAGAIANIVLTIGALVSAGLVGVLGGNMGYGTERLGHLIGPVAAGFSPTSYRAVGIPGFFAVTVAVVIVGFGGYLIVRAYDKNVSIRITTSAGRH